MISENIRTYLINKNIETEDKIYVNFTSNTEGISIIDTGGDPPDIFTGLNYPSIQITTKYKVNNNEKIKEIYNLLNGLYQVNIDNKLIEYCEADQEPFFLKQENSYFIWACNFSLII